MFWIFGSNCPSHGTSLPKKTIAHESATCISRHLAKPLISLKIARFDWRLKIEDYTSSKYCNDWRFSMQLGYLADISDGKYYRHWWVPHRSVYAENLWQSSTRTAGWTTHHWCYKDGCQFDFGHQYRFRSLSFRSTATNSSTQEFFDRLINAFKESFTSSSTMSSIPNDFSLKYSLLTVRS